MSMSKGNEYLQELYARLKGLWEQGKRFNYKEVKELIEKIHKEYENE